MATTSAKPTTINCHTCGAAITALRNGKTTIWTESNGRKHGCPGTQVVSGGGSGLVAPVNIPASPGETMESLADLDAIYDDLANLEKRKAELEAAKLAAEREAAEAELRAAKVNTYQPTIAEGNVPVLDGDYQIDRWHLDAIKRVIALADLGKPQNIGLHGPAGSGKTTLGLQIGALRQSPTFISEAAGKQTADEWYVTTKGIVDGKIIVEPSHFVTGIETENAVMVLNDVALLQDKTVQNGLNELLDPSTRSTFVEQLGRRVTVAKGVIIIGTWNVGSEYTGASELSLQLIDRFRAGALFEVPYPTNGTLADIIAARSGLAKSKADELAEFASWMRSDAAAPEVSTRGLIAAAVQMARGATYGEALSLTVLGEADEFTMQLVFGIISKNRGKAPEWATPQRGNYVRLT